ncbi:small subunit of clathrin adaptor complex [Ordospora colligata]|uniref:Small subunit of clathrin adaptor complex n=1 Tax=Ordospora colligata OC4 TaxID=1354746 RepID=A0A0B2UJ53_9MICR|nr:small subunit of clathrin adaptor complex [Ordospora colligata OC4]KHN69087.1 small subunit of clathrin adaptor complex [Ordospora colligata OC4]TBU14542.1 small subunit of clathrin adaptor complex [Ordospora colligata]TBU14736.1 small subunit of clathrin adaptor complex [Ordospora colligata]TBU18170.1 small subunit of clathrin adaptor complex [Ordospora colligata]
MIKKIYGFSSSGETRLKRTYESSLSDEDIKEIVLSHVEKNIVDGKQMVVFNRFGDIFIAFVAENENGMYVLSLINNLMSIYDRFFSKVCELHFIYNFKETHLILDNYIVNGKCISSDAFEVIKQVECMR